MSSSTGTPSAPSFKAGRDSASSLEPSPASTFGDSASSNAGDDDFPQTPGDEGVMLSKLSKLSVNDGKATGRYSPPFVRNGSQSKVEDPFTSPQHRSGQRTPTGPKHKGRSSMSGNWRSGSSSGSGSGNASPSAVSFIRGAQSGQGVFVQEYTSDNGELTTAEQLYIKPEDAQAIFPPSSCVFVANLLQSEGDEALEVAVTQIFREYGTVYVKIRRDTKHMPFAFCQYTNDADAERAIKEGRGRLVKGRPCRCEKAKAHRLFFFERKYGEDITPAEVQQLLRPFGKISFCRRISPLERACYDINGGVLVQFEMYDEGQAAQQAFRNHSEYKMQCMANMNSRSPAKSNPNDRSYLDTYEVDKRSIFVGNLSIDVTEADLAEIFHQFGGIVHVTLHKADSTVDVNQKHCFAFVEFQQQPSVSRALATMQGYVLHDRSIRVAQKDTEAAKNRTRRQPARLAHGVTSTMATPAEWRSPIARASGVGQGQASTMAASPIAYMTPPGYASPYAFAQGGQYYGYPATTLPAQVQYYSPAGYSPSALAGNYFSYTGSPTYNTGASSAATTSGSPTQAQYYYGGIGSYTPSGYTPGGYTPYVSNAGYWHASSPAPAAVAQHPVSYYTMPTYSPPAATNTVQEDRSATPTPAGHPSAAEASLETE